MIIVNKPPGVVCQLRDDKVVSRSTVPGYSDGLTNVPSVPLRKQFQQAAFRFGPPPPASRFDDRLSAEIRLWG